MIGRRLPAEIEAGAVKRRRYSTEVVETDGGEEQRNARWSASKSQWDIVVPADCRDSAAVADTEALFDEALGSLETWMFHDPVTCVDVEVRFSDDELTYTCEGNLVEISATLEEAS